MRNRAIILMALVTLAPVSAASAKKAPKPTWQVTRTSDPITGASSCVVAAYDRAGRTSYSRTGVLYPLVENNSVHGLLVGVSSGGRFRLPTGDILWRIDDRPFRSLRAADNPAGATASAAPQIDTAVQKLVADQMRMISAVTATSTLASGEMAKAMLAEMLAGSGLIYRAAAITPDYGLPTGTERAVGQVTANGLRPIPLDTSFRAGLVSCDVTPAE